MTQIQLSVEEALDFQKFSERMEGIKEGVQMMTNRFTRSKLDDIIAARARQTVSDSTIAPKTDIISPNEPQPADATEPLSPAGNAGG